MLSYLLDLVGRLGAVSYALIFAVSALECAAFLGLFVPGESLLLACGFLVHRGTLNADAVVLAAVAGAIIGDNIGYSMGANLGREWLLAKGARFGITPQSLGKADSFFERHGSKAVFLGRFVGYARALVPFIAGTSRMRRRTFLVHNALGALLWGTGVVALGYAFGASWRLVETWIGRVSEITIVVLIVMAGIAWVRRRRRRAR